MQQLEMIEVRHLKFIEILQLKLNESRKMELYNSRKLELNEILQQESNESRQMELNNSRKLRLNRIFDAKKLPYSNWPYSTSSVAFHSTSAVVSDCSPMIRIRAKSGYNPEPELSL